MKEFWAKPSVHIFSPSLSFTAWVDGIGDAYKIIFNPSITIKHLFQLLKNATKSDDTLFLTHNSLDEEQNCFW